MLPAAPYTPYHQLDRTIWQVRRSYAILLSRHCEKRGHRVDAAPIQAVDLGDAVAAKPELLQISQPLQPCYIPDLIGPQLQQSQVCELMYCLQTP